MKPSLHWLAYLTAGLLCAAASGCGSGVIVKGQVIKDGKPLQPRGREEIAITFYPADNADSKTFDFYVAYLRPDGTYVMAGQTGKGIPRGKYRIEVGQAEKRKKDRKKGSVGEYTIEIVREVTGKKPIDIDLDHPRTE